jgi:hypothetical protein
MIVSDHVKEFALNATFTWSNDHGVVWELQCELRELR